MPFDAATIQLQRDLLDKTTNDVARDRRLLAKQPANSRSKMATTLRERIAEGQRVVGDLTGLIKFMEGINREHAEEEALAVGDVLTGDDPEPPVGTVVMLQDGSDEQWKRMGSGEWSWGAQHNGYQPVWRWRRVTFDGPVTVIEVPGANEAGR